MKFTPVLASHNCKSYYRTTLPVQNLRRKSRTNLLNSLILPSSPPLPFFNGYNCLFNSIYGLSSRIECLLAIAGFLKLLFPPFIKTLPVNQSFISEIKIFAANDLVTNSVTTTGVQISPHSWLMMLWFFISISFLFVIITRTIRLKNIFKGAKLINISKISNHSLAKRVKFYQTDKNHSPLLLGLVQNKVILPKDWDSWTATYKSTVITHELNHVQNKDTWYNFLNHDIVFMALSKR